ncbi:MAG: hypothetical protein WCI36_03995 [bacterium]
MQRKLTAEQEAMLEARLSVAIVRDVIKRHFNFDYIVATKDCLCGYCQKTIARGNPAISVKNFERKKSARIIVCDKGCLDGHETAEIAFFGCKELEKLPTLDYKKRIMNKDDLIIGYYERLLAAKQNAVDNVVELHRNFQMQCEYQD